MELDPDDLEELNDPRRPIRGFRNGFLIVLIFWIVVAWVIYG